MFVELKSRILRLLREDEEFRYAVAGLLGLDEVLRAIRSLEGQMAENTRAIRSLQEQVSALQEQVLGWSGRVDRLAFLVEGLGARWGALAEESFRSGVKGLVEGLFGGRVRRWVFRDEEGFVFGRPSIVEVDLVVSDGGHVLVEVKSSVSRADVFELWRIGRLYERVEGVRPRLAFVSPYVDDRARGAARELGIELYTG